MDKTSAGRRGRQIVGCGVRLLVPLALALPVPLLGPAVASAADDLCDPVLNPITCENSRPGSPASSWEVSSTGRATIEGFATAISVNVGETQQFKVKTSAASYRLDIYRMGYYAGNGARLVATVNPVGRQSQPACLNDASTGLIDCGNWTASASWTVPTTAVSGIYFARAVRTDGTTGANHIFFIVRDDSSHSPLLFQTSDTTWQAYNQYGGNSLYVGSPDDRAYKVSYNRPFTTRDTTPEDWVFNSEYPMVRFLEGNGYDVTYLAGADVDRRGELLRNHQVFMSVGHDEYVSGAQRANIEAARDAGVHLAFFSGNEIFWKTRWEPGTDAAAAPYRTLVCYKETHADQVIDPLDPPTSTGTWRDPRFGPPADGGRPENAVSGTSFIAMGTQAMKVPAADGRMRFWRNTSIARLAAGSTATLTAGTLGYEWDEDADNGARPAGLIRMSTTKSASGTQVLQDYGSTYGSGSVTHHLTLYRAASGALVFGAGTVQWPWGLDSNHDRGSAGPSVPMRQATVNLFADMGVQPDTVQADLTVATRSSDTVAPTVAITSPVSGATVVPGTAMTVTGTATDTGGVVGGVEVSTDGGASWHPAAGRESWSYAWTPETTGPVVIKARASDDSVNLGPAVSVNLGDGGTCPCSMFVSGTPAVTAEADPNAVEVGVRFRSDVAGQVTGIRFYKGTGNTGTHTGHLWTAAGASLATATFGGESASGWQQATFATPVPVSAGSTYVASYYAPAGRYAVTEGFFASAGRYAPPLQAPQTTASAPNGVYRYGSGGGFPTDTWAASNYWVDVVFTTTPVDTVPPTVTAGTPVGGASGVPTGTTVVATFSEPVRADSVILSLRSAGGAVSGGTGYDEATRTATFRPAAPLAPSTVYTVQVSGATDVNGNTMEPVSWSFSTAPAVTCPCSLWAASATPAVAAEADPNAVEVGVRFRSDVAGQVTAVRFYKGTGNTGTHIGHLWTETGQLLATVTFSGETASGWQQANLQAPVTLAAGTTYVVSYYAPAGRYAVTENFFASSGRNAPPLQAPQTTASAPNGVYRYGSGGVFPTDTWTASNYWVDVVFTTTAA